MQFWSKDRFIKYRAQGLSLAQTNRLPAISNANSRLYTTVIAGLAFVAVGSLAFTGLQSINASPSALRYSVAPPIGTARQVMMAHKVPYDRKVNAARLALMNTNAAMEIQSLAAVEQITNPEAATTSNAIQPIRGAVQVAQLAPPQQSQQNAVQVAAVAAPLITDELTNVEFVAALPEISCFSQVIEAAAETTLLFKIGSAQLKPNDMERLSAFGQIVADCPQATVQVTGHSDTSGNDLSNLNLSWKRADNTIAAMTQLGLDTEQFAPIGFGARAPLSQGGTSDDELNRRVEFKVLRAHESN